MKPVKQTIFGKSTGNCWAACVASLLEIDLEEVPNFCAKYDNDRWFAETRKWLRTRGLEMLMLELSSDVDLADLFGHIYWIAGGKSPRGRYNHATIYRGAELVHDPHPDDTGLRGVPKDGAFLVQCCTDHYDKKGEVPNE